MLSEVLSGFWGSRPAVDELLAELCGKAVEGPPADWDVGHFCEVEIGIWDNGTRPS